MPQDISGKAMHIAYATGLSQARRYTSRMPQDISGKVLDIEAKSDTYSIFYLRLYNSYINKEDYLLFYPRKEARKPSQIRISALAEGLKKENGKQAEGKNKTEMLPRGSFSVCGY